MCKISNIPDTLMVNSKTRGKHRDFVSEINELFHVESKSTFWSLDVRFLEKYYMMFFMSVACCVIRYTINNIYCNFFTSYLKRNVSILFIILRVMCASYFKLQIERERERERERESLLIFDRSNFRQDFFNYHNVNELHLKV